MSKRLSQHLFSPIAAIQIILLSLLTVLALALTTPLGPALIEKITSGTFTPLKIKGFRGSFLTDLKVASLTWKDPATTVELEQINIKRPRYGVDSNTLKSLAVSAKRLVIRLPKSEGNPSEKITSLPDFALPLNIKTDTLAIESFEVIRENEVIFQIKDIVLTQLNIEQGKLKAEALAAQLIIIGAPLNMKVQNFAMNMNQPHNMQGRGMADFKHPQIGKADANFEVAGNLVNYKFKLAGNLENEFSSPQAIQLEGAGDYDQVTFSSIKTKSLDGNIQGKAEVKWAPELDWRFEGQLEQVKLAKHLPDWPAEFDARLTYQGGYKNNSLYGELDLDELAGLLKDKKISASGKIQHKDEQLTLENVQADLGQNTIKASGSASPPFDLSWDINADNVNQLLPEASLDLSGQLTAKGTLKGNLEQPLLNANIHAKNLRYQHYKLGSAHLIAESKQGVYKVRGDLDQLELDQQKISDAKLDASGTIEDHQVKLAFTHTDAKVKLAAQGGWKDPQWKGSLQQLLLDTQQVSKWRLQKPVQISASKDQLKSSQFCLANRAAQTCSTLQWSAKKGVNIEGNLKQTPLALLSPFLPKALTLKGKANGRYALKQQGDKIVGDVTLQLPAGLVTYGTDKDKQRLHYKSLTVKAIIDGQKITANGKLLLKNNGKLSADAHIVLAKTGNNHQIEAKGKLSHLPLVMAKPWLPKDIQLNGHANGHFNLKQTKGKPVGDVQLQLPASSVVMGKGKQRQRIDYQSLMVKAQIKGKKITANTQLMLKNKGELTANAKIVLASRGADIQIDTKGKLKRIPLAMAKPWLPNDIKLNGSANGSFNLQQKKGKPVGDVILQLPASSVMMGEGKQRQRIDYKSLTVKALINGKKITANTQLLLKNRGELAANATLVLASNGGDMQVDAKGTLKRIPLMMAKPWLPNDITLNGSANGHFNLQQKKGKAVGDVVLQLPASSVLMGAGKQRQRIDYKSLTVKALINGKKITANTRLLLKNKGELAANATIVLASAGTDIQIKSQGKLKRIPLAMAKPWLPNDIQLNGSANGNFKLKQSNGKPVGEVSLHLPASAVLIGKGKQKQRLDYQSLTVNALINGQKITANTKLVLKNRGELTANARIHLAKKGNNHRITAKGKLTRLPLAMAKPWLPKDIQLSGSANGHFDLKQQNGKAVGNVSLRLPPSTVIVGAGRDRQRIDYQSLALNARINGQKINANTTLSLKNRGQLSADANILLAKSGGQPHITVKGKLNRIPLAMAKPWLPKDLRLNGLAKGRFNLKPKNGKLVGDALLQLPASSIVVGQGKDRQRIDYKSATLNAIIKGDNISANTTFILKNKAKLTANATINLANKKSGLKINGKGKLTRLPLAMLQPWMPQAIQLKGSANGQFNLKQMNGKPIGEISLQLPASSIFVGEGKAKEKIDYRSLTLGALVNGNKITANTRLLLQNKGELSANATIILDPKGNHHQIDARGKLNRIPLAMTKPWLPDTLTLNGTANGGFKLKQASGKTTGNLIIQLPRNTLIIADEAGSLTTFNYHNAFVKASINNKTIRANAKMQLNDRGNFTADAKILLGKTSNAHRLQGTAAFNIPNIHWMQSFVPQTSNLYGGLSSKVSFNGRLTAPKVIGQIALKNASLKLTKVGTHLRNINLSVKANDANRAVINGSLVSGQGKVTLQGFISLRDLKKLTAEMRIKGNNFQFINTHEAVAVMNPDITIKMNPKTIDILGRIHIPNAKITLNAIPESSIDESEDVIVIGEKKSGGNLSAVKIRPNIIVSLGKDVKFQGFGLDAKLGGSVRVTHNQQVIVAQGSIKINKGRYQAYGQNLTINNGRLVFNGPPTHIGMDIKAVRQIDDINAGIHLTGTLRKPKTKLFSSPSLSESNILSYLLTGHSIDEITGSQTALLLQAVRSMNVTGGDGLVRSIGNSLGLDDLSIIPKDDLKKSELRLGKKLGSKLYVRYIVGIFDAAQKIALEYKVNKYLNLEAQAGADAQSLDLIYQVETD